MTTSLGLRPRVDTPPIFESLGQDGESSQPVPSCKPSWPLFRGGPYQTIETSHLDPLPVGLPSSLTMRRT